jgi:hypothetical protein
MVNIRPTEIIVRIPTPNPVEDLFSFQNALLAMIQHVDPLQLESSQAPLYFYMELLRNFLPDANQWQMLLGA